MTQRQTQHGTHQTCLGRHAQLLVPPKSLLFQAIYSTYIALGRGLMSSETFSLPLGGSELGGNVYPTGIKSEQKYGQGAQQWYSENQSINQKWASSVGRVGCPGSGLKGTGRTGHLAGSPIPRTPSALLKLSRKHRRSPQHYAWLAWQGLTETQKTH